MVLATFVKLPITFSTKVNLSLLCNGLELLSAESDKAKLFAACERPRFDSPCSSYQQISLPPRAARPTQPSILPRSVNEYQIIPGLTRGHRRWGLLPSTTTGGISSISKLFSFQNAIATYCNVLQRLLACLNFALEV